MENNEKKPHGLKGKPSNGKNSPVIGNNGLQLEPGDNSRYIEFTMLLSDLPAIDLHNVGEVQERLSNYFSMCSQFDMKPTVAGLGLALNLDRRRLWEIKTGTPSSTVAINELPTAVKDSIKKAYVFMENLWENYMQNGKINPMSGVFLGVNNYGYQDVKQVNLTPIAAPGSDSDYDAEAIRQRYMIDSGNSEKE